MWAHTESLHSLPTPRSLSKYSLLAAETKSIATDANLRDSAIFTSKRLIIRDAQGFTGKKVEIYSIPYSSINMWSNKVGDVVDGYDQKPGQAWVRCGYSDPKNGLVHRRLILECMRAIECHNE